MIMRFRGGGVGHTSTRAAMNAFKADRDVLDMKSGQNPGALTAPEPFNVEDRDDEDMADIVEDMADRVEDMAEDIVENTAEDIVEDTAEVMAENMAEVMAEVMAEDFLVEAEAEIDDEGDLSDSELVDYGYELGDSDSEEDGAGDEEDDDERGEEDDTTIEELDELGYADY